MYEETGTLLTWQAELLLGGLGWVVLLGSLLAIQAASSLSPRRQEDCLWGVTGCIVAFAVFAAWALFSPALSLHERL